MTKEPDVKSKSPLEAKVALAALGNLIESSPTLEGHVTGNKFYVRIPRVDRFGIGMFGHFPNRGILRGRIVQSTDGSVLEGNFEKSYISKVVACATVIFGFYTLTTEAARDSGIISIVFVIAFFGFFTALVLWLPQSGNEHIKRETINAVQGQKLS
ncbi:MAG: hypothetical protein ACR2QW_10515 [bacterium]